MSPPQICIVDGARLPDIAALRRFVATDKQQ